MEQSILKSVKKILGIDPSYTAFDFDILVHINSAFATLNQLGVGPDNGFAIEDDTAVWASFIGGDPRYNPVKTYVYLKVRQLFDPPTTSYLIEAMQKQVEELEWRIKEYRESNAWTNPNDATTPDESSLILDGGSP